MRNLIGKGLVAVPLLALLLALPLAAQEPPAEKAPKPAKPLSLYRVNFAIHEVEDGKVVNTRNYSQLVEEGGNCRVRAGHKVALTVPIQGVPSTQYLDVGFRLDCAVSEAEGYVRLEIRLDITSFAEQQTMEKPLLRNISAEVMTAVIPGKPTVVSSIDDSVSKRRYELEVTATKVK